MAEEKQNVMTAEGMQKIQEQLDYLIGTRRNEIAKQIDIARGFGDLSENAEYDEAKKEQAKVEEEILRLQNKLRTAVILSESEITTEKVSIGTTVKVFSKTLGSEFEYSIVGSEETDPWNGKISSESPVGAALLGTRKGEVVTVELPMGVTEFEILDIRR